MLNIERMKNGAIFYILFCFVSYACGEDEEVVIEPESFTVSFDFQSLFEIDENDPTEIIIPIKLNRSLEESVAITYETIGQDVVNGSDYSLLSANPLVIAPGSLTANVRITINDNSVPQPEDRRIFLRIRSINLKNGNIGVPKEVIISIKEDDCDKQITDVKTWFGELTIQSLNSSSAGMGSENAQGVCSGLLNVKGKFIGENNPESTLTVSLVKDSANPTTGEAAINRSKLFTFTNQYEIEATGTYDEEAGRITLNYEFFDLNSSANNFESTAIITTN